ncbi:Carboxylesterase type B [Trinorchestia longiramus]|nr:Carboxylesterase type B [Trinorchestia longiramus]
MKSTLVSVVVAAVSLLLVPGGWSEPAPQVEVTGGPIVGSKERSIGGRPYYAYRAVPYAAPPVNELKFKPPAPPVPWTEPLTVDTAGPFCVGGGRGYMSGEEDCLTVSVYSPREPGKEGEALPVLVWLPGGAYIVSGSAAYDPTIMMDVDIVLVIPQYRLGIYGFLYMSEAAPGNYGMLDQVAALRWVQDNIQKFGGDPSRVTLAGDCAGGASALYHMISPLSEGLFHGVISMSGSPLNPWARQLLSRQISFVYSIFTGCPRYSFDVLKGCFANTTTERMKLSLMTMSKSRTAGPDLLYIGNNNQAPVVQSSSYAKPEEQFLDEEPVIKFGQGNFAKVPVLMIASKDEGNFMLEMALHNWTLERTKKDESFNDGVVQEVGRRIGLNSQREEVLNFLWDNYFQDLKNTSYEEKIPAIAKLLTDSLYLGGIAATARYLNDKVPTYLLRYDYEGGPHYNHFNRSEIVVESPLPAGAGNLDPLMYLLPERFTPFTNHEQSRVGTTLLYTITSFVKGRLPGPKWPTVTDEGLESLVISKSARTIVEPFMSEQRAKAADLIFKQHHKGALDKLKRLIPRDEL